MVRLSRLGVLAVGLTFTLLCGAVSAQSFSFSIGSYPGCRHHHHCGPYYGFGWYPPPLVDYVYVYPPPRVTYVQPAIVQPLPAQYQTSAPANATPVASSSATVKPAAQTGDTLQIWNSSGQRVGVAFLVNSQRVELADGQSHSFYGGGARTIEFDRGGAFGSARYELTGGEHEFVLTARGWDLVPRASRAATIALQPMVPKNALPTDRAAR